MKIKLPDEATTERVAAELLHILVNIRDKQLKWNNQGGALPRLNLKYWENKADDFLESLKQYEIKNED